ncbi:MAG: Rha family transcriptional regulator, partial [Thiomargarita sp.]|nr:Rha family transcriptional regulator [Thiomargarita sp.]
MKKLTMSTQTFANVTGINYPKVLLMVKKRLNLDSFPTISEVTHQHNDHETYDANKITYHLTRFHCHSMVMNLSKTISEAVFTKFDEFEDLAKRDFDANLASLSTKRLAVLASDDVMTMSTLEIADVTSKMHKDVLDDARDMFEGLGIASAEFTANRKDIQNKEFEVYNLPFNLTLLLVTGYDLTLRKRVIDEWIKLEKIVRELTPKLPDLQQEIMPTTTRDIAKYL